MNTSLVRVLLPLVLLSPPALAAQRSVVRGTVAQAGSGAPVAGAVVAAPELNLRAVSDARGRYVLAAPRAALRGRTVTLTAAAAGFAAQERRVAVRSDTTTVDFRLAPEAVSLEGLVVTAPKVESRARELGSPLQVRITGRSASWTPSRGWRRAAPPPAARGSGWRTRLRARTTSRAATTA